MRHRLSEQNLALLQRNMHKRCSPWRNDHGCRRTTLDPDARPDRRCADDRLHEGRSGENRLSFASYAELHRWSIDDREAFWDLVWDFCGIVGDKGDRVLVDGEKMPGAAFFPDATLNFAENLLKKTGTGEAIVFRGEDKVERRLSWNELQCADFAPAAAFPVARR